MKKIIPIILAIWPYLFLLSANIFNENYYSDFFYAYIVLTIFVYVINIIFACSYKRAENDCYKLAFWNMLIKLIHIPFYLIIAATGILLLLAMVLPMFIIMSPIMVICMMIADYLLMITTSAYGINALIRAKQNHTLSANYTLFNIVLHFVFILDTVSAVMLFIKLRKQRNTRSQL